MTLTNSQPDEQSYVEGFWEAARRGELVVQHCDVCGEDQMYPRRRCVQCGAAELSYRPVSGHGLLYSFSTVVRNAPSDFADEVPYTLAIVQLDEGPRLLTRVEVDDPGHLRCDMAVECLFRDRQGSPLPSFTVASSAATA